jgi:hypothetical protein
MPSASMVADALSLVPPFSHCRLCQDPCGPSLAAPVLSTSERANTAKSTSAWLTVSGLQFGSFETSATAHLDASESCTTSAWTSSTTLQCYLTAAANMEDSLIITVVGAAGTLAQGFTFDGALCACAWVCCQLTPKRVCSQRRSRRPHPRTPRLASGRGSQ